MSPVRPTALAIAAEDLTRSDVLALLDQHLAEMHKFSPACKVNSLPPERLAQPDVTFFTARADEELAAVGALKRIDPVRGELKAMRAADNWRGRGAGTAILLELLNQARARGYVWVGLETGRHKIFHAAQHLYAKHGFSECDAFGDYQSDDFSMCMGMDLQ